MPVFHRNEPTVAEANVPDNWIETGVWRDWVDCPHNVVRGEAQYQEDIRGLAGPIGKKGVLIPVPVVLKREPSNRYDENAIRAEIAERVVGYLARDIAAALAPLLDSNSIPSFQVAGVIRGGWKKDANLGVHLWLHRRLAPGPRITLEGMEAFAVSWPPYEDEGVYVVDEP
jgi:hypothetical protein